MYPDVSYVYPECILDSFEIRVKYMQNVKIHVHVFSWNVTEHLRYAFEIHQAIHAQVTYKFYRIHSRYMHDTSGYVSYRKPHQIV